MKKQHAHNPGILRFRRWSRKGYAAFSSLRRTVTIGNLGCRVLQSLQRKNGLMPGFLTILFPDENGAFSEDADGPDLFSVWEALCLARPACSDAGAVPCVNLSAAVWQKAESTGRIRCFPLFFIIPARFPGH